MNRNVLTKCQRFKTALIGVGLRLRLLVKRIYPTRYRIIKGEGEVHCYVQVVVWFKWHNWRRNDGELVIFPDQYVAHERMHNLRYWLRFTTKKGKR